MFSGNSRPKWNDSTPNKNSDNAPKCSVCRTALQSNECKQCKQNHFSQHNYPPAQNFTNKVNWQKYSNSDREDTRSTFNSEKKEGGLFSDKK